MTRSEPDSDKDPTHTEVATRRCELIVTVSSDGLTAMQTNAGKLRPLGEGSRGARVCEGNLLACVCREYSDGPEENPKARQ